MAPNLMVRTAYCKPQYESVKEPSDHNSIRTDFILQNVFSHLIKNSGSFQAVTAANSKETKLLSEAIEIVDSFKLNYLNAIKNLCSEIEVKLDTLNTVMVGVSNELFCEGITWSRIVSLFVFVGELTLQCIVRNLEPNIIDPMYECFCRLVKENLTGWVEDHGGWEGLRSLSPKQLGNSTQQFAGESDKGWAKSIFHGTVRMIGTLAHIANTTGQSFP